MISKAERQHVVDLKKWSAESRAALKKLQGDQMIGKLLRRIAPDKDAETIYDNVDWLIELIEREEHRYGVRALTRAVETVTK